MMKTVFTGSTVLAIAAVCMLGAESVHAQDKPSGQITLMSYAGIFQEVYTKTVVEPFEKKFPNVDVKYYTTGNSANMLGALRAQRSSPQTDVVIFDASTSLIGDREGLLSKLSEKTVPNLADLVEQATIKEGYGPAVTLDNLVLVYDSKAIEKKPESLGVLWDKSYANKIGVSAMPNIQGIALTCMTAAMVGEDYTKSIDKAVAKLSELAPRVQTFDPKPDGYTMVLNGSLQIATGWNARAQYYAKESDGKLGVMLPKEGSVLQKNTINLVEGSPNADAARAFINYALSPEAQANFSNSLFYAPVNKNTKLSDEARQRTVADELDKMLPLDWGWVAKVQRTWNQEWRRRIISGAQ